MFLATFIRLQAGDNFGWIFLLIGILLPVLYFLIGGYWLFQKVEICEEGIIVSLFGRCIKRAEWENIDHILFTLYAGNTAIIIKTKDGKKIILDWRKRIENAILHFGDERAREQTIQKNDN